MPNCYDCPHYMNPEWDCYKTGTGCVARSKGNSVEVEEGDTVHVRLTFAEYNHILNKLGRKGLKDYIECAGGDFEKPYKVEVYNDIREVEIHQYIEEQY
jgi:hypothetical protein